MFGLTDLVRLIISIFIILPVVSLVRELGYWIAGKLFGAKETSITLGTGPPLFKFWIFNVNRVYFLYGHCTYDSLKKDTKLVYILVYAAPILSNLVVALTINALLANDLLSHETFWNQFIFYAFYFILFDAIPMYYQNGQPSNGQVIYNLIKYGKISSCEQDSASSETNTDGR
ncbi:hypothetical protein D8M04_07120 [Oceanobacillus piezotolerans]|uniref:Uncharacterized protein n=1 Tax=Oceanobacillus piezotolerans TaxID=2448030 RepID=A0A498DE65_9BACI|nr:hypothetical protein [Oceanobacillus piezotolerans]RLL46960.1 hypothetical protein D8M04_07120 [Oceanobacillus piezotolerans]